MRISDWSSDVCSSDLGDDPKATRVRNGGRHLGVTDIVHSALNDRMFDPEEFRDAGFDGHVRFLMDRWTRCTAAHRRDRTSVVSGRSGSVRVDLGCGSSIKQKKTYKKNVSSI